MRSFKTYDPEDLEFLMPYRIGLEKVSVFGLLISIVACFVFGGPLKIPGTLPVLTVTFVSSFTLAFLLIHLGLFLGHGMEYVERVIKGCVVYACKDPTTRAPNCKDDQGYSNWKTIFFTDLPCFTGEPPDNYYPVVAIRLGGIFRSGWEPAVKDKNGKTLFEVRVPRFGGGSPRADLRDKCGNVLRFYRLDDLLQTLHDELHTEGYFPHQNNLMSALSTLARMCRHKTWDLNDTKEELAATKERLFNATAACERMTAAKSETDGAVARLEALSVSFEEIILGAVERIFAAKRFEDGEGGPSKGGKSIREWMMAAYLEVIARDPARSQRAQQFLTDKGIPAAPTAAVDTPPSA